MMKNISKLAALTAAAAFLLATFPACSNDDDDGDKTEQDGTGGDENTGNNNSSDSDDNNNNDEDEKHDEPNPLAVTYDLKDGLPTEITSTDAVVSDSWPTPTAPPATNDVTFSLIATTSRKVKSNSGLQFSNGTTPEEAIKLSAEENITVKVTYKFADTYAANKIREIDVGDKVSQMEAATDKDSIYNVTCSAAKEVTIQV